MNSNNAFVESAQIINGSNGAIRLLHGKHGHSPLGFVAAFEQSQTFLSLKFILEDFTIDQWNGVRLFTMEGLGVRFECNLELTFGVFANLAAEQVVESLQQI